MNIWIQAARPKTLIASISPVLIASIVARTHGEFSFLTFLFTLLTAIGIQVVTNFANDYFDFLKGSDTKKRVGPTRVTAAGLVTPSQMKKALNISVIITFLLGIPLIYQGGLVIAALLILSLFLAVAYTKGRFAIAYRGLGELFVFVFFGPVATSAAYYLQTHELSLEAALIGISPGALSACILLINNIRDEKEDKAAHKNTLVVRFGKTFGKGLYVALMFIATLLPLLFYKEHPYVAITSITAALGLIICLKLFKIKAAKDYIPLLGETAQILLLYTLIFCATWNP